MTQLRYFCVSPDETAIRVKFGKKQGGHCPHSPVKVQVFCSCSWCLCPEEHEARVKIMVFETSFYLP